jgi:thimet oligopeptidase
MSRSGIAALSALLLALVSCAHAPASLDAAPAAAAVTTSAASGPPRFFTGNPDANALRASCEAELARARENLDRMLAVSGVRTIENTLEPYNRVMTHADNAGSWSSLLEAVHPDSAYRATAETLTQATSKFLTEVSLNRAVYDALQAVDVSQADPATRHFVTRTLRDFRLAGVDRDEATRKRVQEIREELVLVSQEFHRNIRNDSPSIQVTAAELEGLPKDYLDAHAPGPDGKISISIEYPDRFPVMTYAKNGEVRRKLQHAALNRAWPANETVLDSLVAKRHRLARILGYPNWADYVTADKMIGNGTRAAEFIERIGSLTREQAVREYAVYLKRKQEDDPAAKAVQRWEARYYEQLIRKRDFDYDMQEMRAYFPFEGVKRGILDVNSKLFGVTFTRIENAAVWHPSVEAYELHEGDRLIGRFFLDLHPRPGKYNHAAAFNVRTGVEGVQIPEASLVCNFAGGRPGDPGLMEHDDVLTFFHEFGHLLHGLFGGHQRWMPVSGIATEWDFVEAPSQMLEEWGQNASVLQTFAKHHETGAPIPAELVAKMRRAKAFGRGIDTSYQVLYAALSLNLYNRDPSHVDPDSLTRAYEAAYVPYPPMPDTHFQASFGHLEGYSAIYYTYLWSHVIAKDLFSRFDRGDMLAAGAASKYRKLVLEPGGTKPAAQLVRDFLGRDFQYEAYEKYLRGEN